MIHNGFDFQDKTKENKKKRRKGETRRPQKVDSELQTHENKAKSDNCNNDDIVLQIPTTTTTYPV